MTLPETESLELWALTECWWALIEASVVVAAAVTEVVLPRALPAGSSVEDMPSSGLFRLSKDRADDFVRLCKLPKVC
jgi:hypothetical protein